MKQLSAADLRCLVDTPLFRTIGAAADALGVECYVVGGYVRDLFLGRASQDVDIVVVGSGIAVAQEVRRRLGRGASLAVFRRFGTAQLKHKEQAIEFVGARKESYSHDSRKPVVEEGTLADDQERRDFTINALALCLNADYYGELVDPFDGLYDLEDGIIRTPLDPDITFSDDPLRMLRCVRFATQLNFFIADDTFDALARNKERIAIVSGERVAEEMNKMLLADTPSKGLVDLQRCGLLAALLPEVSALDSVESRNGHKHKNNFFHTLEVVDNVARRLRHEEGNSAMALWLLWAALLHDIGKPRTQHWDSQQGWTFHSHNSAGAKMVRSIFTRLKLPLDSKLRYVEKLVDLHMRPIVIANEAVTDSAVRRLLNDAGDDVDDLMLLCEADITSRNEVRRQQFINNFHRVREQLRDLQERDYKRLLQPVIDGNEIMALFHLPPSATVGILKQYLKDAVLDNKVPNEREALMQLLIEKAHSMGLDVGEA